MVRGLSLLRMSVAFLRIACTCTAPEPALGPPRRDLGRVDKLNPDSNAGKQHEGGEALDQLVVAGGDTA